MRMSRLIVLTWAAAGAAGLASAPPAAAQDSVTTDALARCRVIADPTMRLFCYDRIVDTIVAGQRPAVPPQLRAPAPAPAAPAPPPVSAAPASPAARAPVPAVPATPSARPAAPAATPPPAASTPPARTFGEENLPSSRRAQPEIPEPDTLRAVVAKVEGDAYGMTVLTLDNGQVWRQAEGTRYRIKPGTRVTLSRGVLGAFFLTADGTSLAVKFKRVK